MCICILCVGVCGGGKKVSIHDSNYFTHQTIRQVKSVEREKDMMAAWKKKSRFSALLYKYPYFKIGDAFHQRRDIMQSFLSLTVSSPYFLVATL